MSKTYKDKYSRYHDKPCVNGEPSSNNGWIYSAYGRHLAPNTQNHEKLLQCYNECLRSDIPLKIDRSPNDKTPPLSKDEIIGLVSLGMVSAAELEASYWNFCNLEYTPEKLNLATIIRAGKVLYAAREEHRNYVWQNEVVEAYPLAFYLPPEDQYYVKKFYGERPSILQVIFFYLNFITVLTKGGKSARMMMWLKLTDLKHWLLRFIPKEKYIRAYFDEEHPFVEELE